MQAKQQPTASTSASIDAAQSHLLPRHDVRIGSMNNVLDIPKRNYVIKMRQSLITENSKNIIFEDGSLNFKYFNVKKGHYWSKEENEKLIQGVLRFGATDFKQIRKECFTKSNWSETEIRLRICRLLKCYDLKPYEEKRFTSRNELLECARNNKEEAIRQKKVCGGILYNPAPEAEDGINTSFFNMKKQSSTAAK